MLDTVRLRSPYLEEPEAREIERQLYRRIAVKESTGQLQYNFISDELQGSWDNRISVQVRREEFVPLKDAKIGVFSKPMNRRQKGVVKEPCPPYLVIEGSVHKALLGHNIAGGPLSLRPAVSWFVTLISEQLGADLPAVEGWEVRRVDWAECFLLPSFEAVEEYIGSLNNAVYPRRKVVRYQNEAIFSPGTTTAVKAYHKGPELGVHDRKRLRMVMTPAQVVELQDLANRVLRIETSVKAKKLGEAAKSGKASVVSVKDEFLQAVHDQEVRRLLNEGRSEMTTVRTHKEVTRRLFERYTEAQAGPLFGTWVMLATLGEKEVRKQLKRRTFFDHKKKLIDAGCTWTGTDIQVTQSAIPKGFAPTRDNPFRMVQEDPEVTRQLEAYRAAA